MKLQLWISAEKLPTPSANWFGKKQINAFAAISDVTDDGSVLGVKRNRLQVTEVVPQTPNPEWATTTILFHNPGTEHRIAVDVFHSPNMEGSSRSVQKDMSERDFSNRSSNNIRGMPPNSQHLCGLFFDIETLLSQKDYYIVEKIPGAKGGRITARIERCENVPSSAALRFQLRGFSLPNTRSFLERPDFFFEVRRVHRGKTQDQWCLVYRSQIDPSNLNPTWDLDDVGLGKLCNYDLDCRLLVKVSDMDHQGHCHLVGQFEATVRSLIQAKCQSGTCELNKAFTLTKDQLVGGHKMGQIVVIAADIVAQSEDVAIATSVVSSVPSMANVVSATRMSSSVSINGSTELSVSSGSRSMVNPEALPITAMAVPVPPPADAFSFQSYVRNGRCNVDMCVAIDFTKANGDFNLPGTCHHRMPGQRNDYEWLMSVAGEAISSYSHTQDYPIWGFGGDYGAKTYQIFQCGSKDKANGIQGLLQAYASTFQTGIAFGTKRKFDNVIQAAAHHAKKQLDAAQAGGSLSYTVLLVLTPGNDSDILAAKDKIVSVAGAPLSILFMRISNGMGQPSFDDRKLDVYLSNKNCRQLCTCWDSQTVAASRDEVQLKKTVLQSLMKQLPTYFHQRGIP